MSGYKEPSEVINAVSVLLKPVMGNSMNGQYTAKAFVSCSLREEDKPFVDCIENILRAYNIEPFGTVGRYSASPENPAVLMKKNISIADLVVVCVTPRYSQKDLKTGEVSHGFSEMTYIETGIAYANNKPLVVFVQEGTDVGKFIPKITQYITLNGQSDDFAKKQNLIKELLISVCMNTKDIKQKPNESNGHKITGKVIVVALVIVSILFLAIYGFYTLINKKFKK